MKRLILFFLLIHLGNTHSQVLSGSLIADSNDEQQILSWLGYNCATGNLLYRKSLHGGDCTTFHALCDGQGPTILLVETTTGERFGAFRSTSYISGTNSFALAPGSFLINYVLDTKLDLITSGQDVFDSPTAGPNFGGGFDLAIDAPLTGGYSNLGSSYECPVGTFGSAACQEYLAGSYGFGSWTIAEMEIYTISELVDTQNPSASNPVSVSVQCTADVPVPDVSVVTDEVDNCGTPTVAFVSDVSDNQTCPETITRTYSVTDDASNQITVTQTITVNDDTNPTASNPSPISVECSAAIPSPDILVVTDESDNCSTPTVAFVSDVSDGQSNPETITRTYTVTDDCDNSISVTQTITVNDVTNPTASNPSMVTVECIADVPAVDIAVVNDEADNCTTSPVVAHVSDLSDGNTCPEIITRTYSVTDDAGNIINVTQTITVNDQMDPVPDNGTLSDITAECQSSPTAPTATDNCSGSITATPDVTFPITTLGTTTVTWTYADDCGNSVTQTQSVIISEIDNSVSISGTTITAVATGYQYQWVDCDNGNAAITGETGQSFTPTMNGNYAVEITDGSCTVTSACTQIDGVGIVENGFGTDISVYPNPTRGIVMIDLGDKYENISIEVLNMTGQVVQRGSYTAAQNIELNIEGADGIYLIKLTTEEESALIKITKD